MSKNFDKIHVNGVYKSVSEEDWVVAPSDKKRDHMPSCLGVSLRIGINNTHSSVMYPNWMQVNDVGIHSYAKSYDFIEYLGEYDWKTGEIIKAKEMKEKNLVSENQIGTEKVYEFGIFRLKKTTYTNECESTIEIGCRGITQSENPLEYLTFDEFKQLQELIKDISLD
jgi:hypothetical protein